jgi:hypothetical protein
MENVLKIVQVEEEKMTIHVYVKNVHHIIVIHVQMIKIYVKTVKKVMYFIIIYVMKDVQ